MKTFRTFLETKNMPKVLYIIRGVPGAGKSFKAKELAGETGVIFSTDEFWGTDPIEYRKNWDQAAKEGNVGKKLGEYHGKNYERAVVALKQGVSPIVIDNTNIVRRNFQNYVDAAKEHGYEVRYAEPDNSEYPHWQNVRPHISSKNQKELEKASEFFHKNNKHGVPQDAILRMLNQFEDLPQE